jgi:hypothetical protein
MELEISSNLYITISCSIGCDGVLFVFYSCYNNNKLYKCEASNQGNGILHCCKIIGFSYDYYHWIDSSWSR